VIEPVVIEETATEPEAEVVEPVVVEEIAAEPVIEPEAEIVEPVVVEEIAPEPEVEVTEPVMVEEIKIPVEPAATFDNFEGGENAGVPAAEPVIEPEVEVIEPVVVEEITTEPVMVEEIEIPVEPAATFNNFDGGENGGVAEIAFAEPEVRAVDNIETIEITTADPTEVVVNQLEAVEPIVNSTPIQNSSFADNLTGWNFTGGNISVVERSPGDRWAKIDTAVGGINQDVSGLIAPGSDYQLNATTQLVNSSARGYVGVRFTTEADELIDLQYVVVGGDTVREEQLNNTAPNNFARAELFAFKNSGSGSLFVDDFSITQQ
ncbi:MAG: hypothetical protein AAFO95_02890, partial [Cyanobacteria bacterium J06600_6]